jgi:hypothetical protein
MDSESLVNDAKACEYTLQKIALVAQFTY